MALAFGLEGEGFGLGLGLGIDRYSLGLALDNFLLSEIQHGFRPRISCLTNVLEFYFKLLLVYSVHIFGIV